MKISSLIFTCLLSIPAAVADGLPNLGDAAQSVFTPQQEQQLGRSIMQQIRVDRDYYDDPEVTQYLNDLGFRLVSASEAGNQNFQFFVIKDPTLNAFALPGGYIGVHTTLLLTTQSESELASVLAHEIGHVTQHHLARMVAAEERNQIPTLAALAVAILAARSNPQLSQAAMTAGPALAVQKELDFTRDNEKEADRTGFQTLTKAGFDPRAMPQFFRRLMKNSSTSSYSAPEYLRTHPLDTSRIADMENRAEQLPYRQVPDSIDFHLMRARLEALLPPPAKAVEEFDDRLQNKRYTSEAAQRYGLTLALMRAKNLTRAESEFAALHHMAPSNAFIENLGAELKMAEGKPDAAIAAYRAGLKTFPRHRALVYGLADALIQVKRPGEAEKFIEARRAEMPRDSHLYELLAKAQAAQGKQMLSHKNLAEAYVLEDNPTAAIEQLQIALKNGNGNFYDQSEVEARLKELRAENEHGPDGKKPPQGR